EGLIGVADVQGGAVRFRVNRHRPDAQLLTGGDHANGDFTTVGDEDLLEHKLSATENLNTKTHRHQEKNDALEYLCLGGKTLRRSSLFPDTEQRFAVLHRLLVRDEAFLDDAAYIRFNLVHQLHRFDYAQDLACLDRIARLHERRRTGRRRLVKRAHD